MDLGLKDKVVLCMASAAGLGKGIATEMAREGAKVMICTAEPFKDHMPRRKHWKRTRSLYASTT